MTPWRGPDGPLVALETSGPVGSVAVARDGRVAARAFLTDARSHASRILDALGHALGEAGIGPGDLRGVLVGSGPGSFTGVRIAAATAKGLAHALGVPLWAFSSLAAAAVTDLALPPGAGPQPWRGPPASPREGQRVVLFDARGGRVYAARYLVSEDALQETRAPAATQIAEVLEGPLPGGVRFAGDGALEHRELIARSGFEVLGPPAGMASADGLIRLLAMDPAAEPLADPAGWEPDYLRASNAERERGA